MVISKPKSGPYRNKKELSKMAIDVRTLNILCRYILSSSSYLRTSHLINLKKFIVGLDPVVYENDREKVKRLKFIQLGLEARIDNNLTDQEMIITHICSNCDFDIDFIDWNRFEMNSDELTWVHKFVEDSLKYDFVFADADEMIDVCTKIKTSDPKQRMEMINLYENKLRTALNYFRVVKQDMNITDMQFSLRDGPFEKTLRDTYDLITNPSRRLLTGMQGFNEMLGGGFEAGRTYMLFGLTGMGKSLVILNLIYQIKQHNKRYKTKDPTKTPCILLLTMENTVVETLTRLFDMVVDNSMGMENYSFDEVLRKLREEGGLVLTNESPIDIVIRYKANRSVDTNYLYEICDDLENDGYEVICLFQDHVKRIRSIWGSSDLRLELGDIVNEFKVFAAEKDIPVITNSHLNRDAARVIEEDASKATHTDVTMKLGKNNAGESLLMLDNLDFACIINPDYDNDGNKFMVFKDIKHRSKQGIAFIVQPFVFGSSIRLVDDMDGEPMFLESLHQNRAIQTRMQSIQTSSTNLITAMSGNGNTNTFSNNNPIYTATMDDPYEDKDPDIKMVNIIRPIRFVNKDEYESSMNNPNSLTQDSLINLQKSLAKLNQKQIAG